VARDTAPLDCEDNFTRKDGSVFPVACSAAIIASDEEASGLIYAFRDETDRKKAEQELGMYATRLEQSNRDLEKFAYVASHDLQAPLIKLQKFSEMLQKMEHLDEEGKDIVNRMQASASRMQELVLGILAVARITTSKKPFESVDLGQVVRNVLEDCEEKIRALNAEVSVGPMDVVEGDPLQLGQMIQNLVDNALKFHRPGVRPEIHIFTRRADDRNLQFVVEDNGIGFKQEYSERIFQMFERLHGMSQYEGTGIGLAIAQKTAEHHHGTIQAYSIPEKGSKFVITIPLKQSA
jgi:light-regulated signal transduction histidine kinase (bacteriophytochrome)